MTLYLQMMTHIQSQTSALIQEHVKELFRKDCEDVSNKAKKDAIDHEKWLTGLPKWKLQNKVMVQI